MCHTSRPVNDYEQIIAERRQDPADLALQVGTQQQLAKPAVTQLQLSVVEFDSVATDLGVVLYNQLSMGPQVTAVSRSFYISSSAACRPTISDG